MRTKELRNEREANVALAAREIPVMQFHPNFLKPAPLRNREKPGIIKTFLQRFGAK